MTLPSNSFSVGLGALVLFKSSSQLRNLAGQSIEPFLEKLDMERLPLFCHARLGSLSFYLLDYRNRHEAVDLRAKLLGEIKNDFQLLRKLHKLRQQRAGALLSSTKGRHTHDLPMLVQWQTVLSLV